MVWGASNFSGRRWPRRSPVANDELMPNRPQPWLRHLAPLLKPYSGRIALAVLAMLGDSLLTAFRPWPLKVVVDRVLSHRHTRVPFVGNWLNHSKLDQMHLLYGACATLLLIALCTGLLTYFYTHTMGEVGRHYSAALRRKLFAHMQRLSLGFHDKQRTGDLMMRLTGDIGSIRDALANGSITSITNFTLLGSMLTIMLWLNWKFALVSLCVAPFLFGTILYHTQRVNQAAREARTSEGLLASLAQETLASIRVVQGLGQEKRQEVRFHGQSETSLQAYLLGVHYRARVAPIVDLLAATGLSVVMWYGATRVMYNELSIGDVIVFFAYVNALYSPMRQLSRLTLKTNKASIGAERVAEIFSQRSDVTVIPGARPAPHFRGHVSFQNVTFGYEQERPVLKQFSLDIKPGEKVAIVGSTGAGKSTLASLILRFYDPQAGRVTIDGRDVREFTIDSLREQISLVLQDSLLFSGTVRENIAFGKPDATDAEIRAAAVAANADEFIRRMPDGYLSMVSERGTTLSGGQKQRIAIARSILRDSPILILDEPTSGLDGASERTVMEAIQRVARGRTTIIITHRLATVRFADRIVVLDGGRIVEQGTHTALLQRSGTYALLNLM